MLGLDFIVVPSDVPEPVIPGVEPSGLVRHLAFEKALAIAPAYPDRLVLAADTIVVLDGDVLGKPTDPDDARRMLRRLAGQRHCVFTGLALVHLATHRRIAAHESTEVCFGDMDDAEIDAYVATGSPLDKAGAYGIQDDRGALFVRRIEGDYYNVVGLPLHRLYRTLRQHFSDLMTEG